MEIILLHNRTAGDEEHSRRRLLEMLRADGHSVRYAELGAALREPDRWRGGDLIVVAGGDGSFRKVVIRFPLEGRPLALLPLGTANNIARTLGVEGSPESIIARWPRARRRRFSVGCVHGPWGRQRFVEGVGIGLFGRAIGILKSWRNIREHEDKDDRVLSDLRTLTMLAHELHPIAAHVRIDGERVGESLLLLEALNISRVGPGVTLVPRANFSDDCFDAVVVRASQRPDLIAALLDALHESKRPRRLASRPCRRIELVLPHCDLRIDDDTVEVRKGTRIEVRMSGEDVEVLEG
ncbi:MAG TPA: diacylglycerol kinase family protein [Candidatus Didemnitutus sp.]|nr:diacylglycerol kinase family protein [Candidatus Didemnitutus sp.]